MNDSTAWSLPTGTERRSGPRYARAARGLRVKCVTWKSLKTIGKRCVFSVTQRQGCVNTILYCGYRYAWEGSNMPLHIYSDELLRHVRSTIPISSQGSRGPIRMIRVPFESALRPAHDTVSTSGIRATPLKFWPHTYGSSDLVRNV